MKKFTTVLITTLSSLSLMNAQIQVEANGVGGREIAYLSKAAGKMYYFGVNETATTNYDFFTHDGTSGTMLKNMCSVTGIPSPQQVYEANGKGYFFFSHNGSTLGNEPYITDGTVAGTTLLKDINPGSGGSGSAGGWFVTSNNKVYFGASDGTTGIELYVTDGTTAGTQLVKDIYVGSTTSQLNQVTAFNNEVWFRALSGTTSGYQLYRSDGTTAGTSQFVYPANLSGPISDLFAHNGFLYFEGYDGSNKALWRTDGTTAGTVKIFQGSGNVSNPEFFNAIGNTLLGISTGSAFPYVYSLYSFDAVTLDTNLLKTGISLVSGQAGNGWALNNKIVFLGKTATSGDEPWVTDGTAAGTAMLADINTGTANSNIYRSAGIVNNELYLNTQLHGIWKTNGTAAGTQSLGVTIDNNYFNSFFDFNNDIYFIKENGVSNKRKLFKLGLSGATGIDENNLSNSVSVYPNPSSGLFFVESNIYENYTVEIFNMLGQKEYSSSVMPEEAIDIRHLSKGIYTARITDKNNQSSTKKIVLDK